MRCEKSTTKCCTNVYFLVSDTDKTDQRPQTIESQLSIKFLALDTLRVCEVRDLVVKFYTSSFFPQYLKCGKGYQ